MVLLVAGTLALGIGVTGVHAALGGGTSSQGTRPDPVASFTPTWSVAPAAVTGPVQPPTSTGSPTAEPTSDPNALADGVYPTYIRGVDVRGATITVDVLQTFFGEAAHQAAIQDGVPWADVQYAPVYIRNENPLLRTLPVAPDVRIKLIGVCIASDRRAGLTKLRKETTPFTDTFYYDVSVVGGQVERIRQLVAVSAC